MCWNIMKPRTWGSAQETKLSGVASLVAQPPANARVTGVSPGPGGPHVLWGR